MENFQTSGKGKEQLIQEARERLDWYTFQASDEEFDGKEVEALVSLLSVLEPMETPDGKEPGRTFEQFKQYMEEKQADAEKLASLHNHGKDSTGGSIVRKHFGSVGKSFGSIASRVGAWGKSGETVSGGAAPGEKPRRRIFLEEAAPGEKIPFWKRQIYFGRTGRYHVSAAAFAALFVTLAFAGGTVSAVEAEDAGGFFNWIYSGIKGEKVVIIPQEDVVGLEEEKFFEYYDESELPEKYQKYVAGIGNMDTLEDYELEMIEVTELDKCTEILYKIFNDREDIEIILGCFAYKNQLQTKQEVFFDYEYLEDDEIDGINYEIYFKHDSMNQDDYTLLFYIDGIQYFVKGKQTLEDMKQITVEYAKMHSK